MAATPQTEAFRVPIDNSELDGTGLPVRVTNPGGGGGGDASAANQAMEIARLDSILTSLSNLLTELQQKLEEGGSVSVANFPGSQAVTGPLTDAQLRAAAVPVSAAALPLPAGAATSAKQDDILTELAQKLEPADLATLATGAKQDAGNTSLAVFLQEEQIAALGISLPKVDEVFDLSATVRVAAAARNPTDQGGGRSITLQIESMELTGGPKRSDSQKAERIYKPGGNGQAV